MKTNYIPAIVTLTAGAVYCLFGIYTRVPLFDFTIQLLIVLFIFFILGGIIRMVLESVMREVNSKTEIEENVENTKEETEENPEKETETSDEEEGM